MNKTTNYQLNQWERTDKVRMEDFNADNAKIDAAIKAVDRRVDGLSGGKADASKLTSEVARLDQAIASKVSIITGTYDGDGAESRFIDLGVTPKALLLMRDDGGTLHLPSTMGGLALPGHPVAMTVEAVTIVEGGFKVSHLPNSQIYTNTAYYTYHYLAFV